MLLKKLLSSLLYFNFVHDFISNAVKKNFTCGGLSLPLYFNFVHDFIPNVLKKFRLRRALGTRYFNFDHF